MSDKEMPPAKIGKSYPLSYFENYLGSFKARDGEFEYRGWRFQRIGRNQVRVISIPEKMDTGDAS